MDFKEDERLGVYDKVLLPTDEGVVTMAHVELAYQRALSGHKAEMVSGLLPTDPKERKRIPIWSGVIKYFPDAIVEIAKVSFAGNEQHNPGEPLHWAREKSTDQEDTTMRHLMESGQRDSDGQRHTAKAAWRILAKLQLEIEAERKGTGCLQSLQSRNTSSPITTKSPTR